MSITRRQFVKRSTGAAAALSFPMVVSSRVLGANEEVRLAIAGLGIRGNYHLHMFKRRTKVSYTALCEPDAVRLNQGAETCKAKYGYEVKQYKDYRDLVEDKNVDAVVIASPQHWHPLMTILACQAGKDVYCEKPASHHIWAGRQAVNAARKYDRIVQTGMQNRGADSFHKAIKFIRDGNFGKIKYIMAFANKPRSSIGKRDTPLPIPPQVDYDLFCGPARKLPLYRDRLHYDWNFDFNMGDGESCNQGVHEVDVARWFLGEKGLPRRVMSIGGRFVFNDAGDCPNTQIIYYDYPTAPVLYEVHNLRAAKNSGAAPTFDGIRTGNVVYCEGGRLVMTRGQARCFDNNNRLVKNITGENNHWSNFIQCVRNHSRDKLNAEILEGHLSTAVCHAGNISYRLGKTAPVAQQRKQVQDVPFWNEMYDRFLEHLKANKIDPNTATLGPWLECDSENECFKDHAKANELVKGYYREPFVVPEVST